MIARFVVMVCFVMVFSRGIFELVSTKEIGYGASVGALGLIFLTVLLHHLAQRKPLRIPHGLPPRFALIYTLMAGVSLYATAISGGPVILGVLYTTLHLFLIWSLVVLAENASLSVRSLLYAVVAAGIVVVVTGLLELGGYIKFPGSWTFGDYDRIAGSLGSKQHYSFASAALGMLVIWLYLQLRIRVLLLLAMALIALCFVSLSRNGIPIVVGTLGLYFAADIKKFLAGTKTLLIIGIIASLGFAQFYPDLAGTILERFTSIVSLENASNANRVLAWENGVDHVFSGSILYGTETGIFSQAGDRLGIDNSMHFESAILQQFANYGIIGGFAFIGFFVSFALTIRDRFLKSLALMLFASFFYYPGSEALPFVAIWLIIAMGAASARSATAQTRPAIEPGPAAAGEMLAPHQQTFAPER